MHIVVPLDKYTVEETAQQLDTARQKIASKYNSSSLIDVPIIHLQLVPFKNGVAGLAVLGLPKSYRPA